MVDKTEAQCNTELTRLNITDCSEVGNVALWRPCTCLVRTKTQSVSHIQKSLYSFHISLMRPTNTFQSSWGTFGGPSTSLKSTPHSYGDKICGKINKTGIENIRGVSFQYNSSFVFVVCVGSYRILNQWSRFSMRTVQRFNHPTSQRIFFYIRIWRSSWFINNEQNLLDRARPLKQTCAVEIK